MAPSEPDFEPKTLVLLLGDALFDGLPGMPKNCPVLMVEDWELCTRVKHHKQKLVLFLSAMRHFADELRAAGREVLYSQIATEGPTMKERLAESFAGGVSRLVAYMPNDRFFEVELRAFCEANGVALELIEGPGFLTNAAAWSAYRGRYKRLFMAEFYAWQRKRLGLLLTPSGEPEGGKWSFDTENRKRLPKGILIPAATSFAPDGTTREVMAEVERLFPEHPGSAGDFHYAVTHADADYALDSFLSHRFDDFGAYEDAISTQQDVLFHSALTPYLNCGLLTPGQIVEAALARHRLRPVPLASLEGFIRQVIGWREFMKGVDREYPLEEELNHFGFQRKLQRCWYTGETGVPILDDVIRRAVKNAYVHHIERLMVVGSAMLMSEVDPADSYRWFMEMFIDSADWVMRPNVLGMSQFADGGLFATKPYLSGSSYLLKMSDYPPGPWCDVWDGLYWRFIDRHRDVFMKNPRMSVIAQGVDRLDPARREKIFGVAEKFVNRVTCQPRLGGG